MNGCPALREFKVVEEGDPCDYPDTPDEFGNYPECDGDVIDPNDYTPDGEDGVDTQVSTSNNIAEHTTVPPNPELSSANNVVQDSTPSTTSDSQDSNNVHDNGANAEANTQGNGNCNKAQYMLLVLSSIVLKLLLN